MKAAVLEKLNTPLTVTEVEPCDLLSGQVLVKILVSGICGAQLQEIVGHKGNEKFLPHLMGHEGCGIVEEIGPDVSTVKKGDKVILHWRKGDGIEADFPTYIFNGRKIQSGKVTTLSEYSIVSENRVTSVPHDIPSDFCALLGCGLSTALGTLINEAQTQSGESVMIVGLGGLGACLLKAANFAKASPIIGVDIHDNKSGIVKALKSDLFINASKNDIKKTLQDALGIEKVDVIIETSGNSNSIANTLPLLGSGGRYVLVGQPKPGESVEIKNANHLFGGDGKTIKATQGGQFSPAKDIPHYVKLYEEGLLNIEGIITHKMKLDQINEAIDLVKEGKAGRIMINM
jgi:S-(hydroxymethyl)glutathione dehydrogenase / alcohol dehydrogenase